MEGLDLGGVLHFFSFLSDVSILRYSMLFTITIIQLYDIHLVLLFSFGIHVDI